MAKKENMAMVVQAGLNNGLSLNQAQILAAEIGRENAFQDKYLWGTHYDPYNKAVNAGIISWQGKRARGLMNYLQAQGVMEGGKIVKGQKSLDAQMAYLLNEMRTQKDYAPSKKLFLDNPNVDYNTGVRVLGKNFIRWRIDDPAYAAKGARNRDGFYKQITGITPQAGAPMAGTVPDTSAQPPAPPQTVQQDSVASVSDTSPMLPPTDTASQPAANNSMMQPAAETSPSLSGLNQIYADAAKTIAAAQNLITGAPMVKSDNPLLSSLSALFDSLEV
uniref:Morphogenesis protein 1, infection, phi29, Late protein.8A n=1 Tax=Podoviridae sp. ctlpi2 TaxID=2826574 RepID=A0A8S5MLN4_9CAUD|nr:MAG TPA: Morphogenesis protein 1, infection, phi29, Late protein.8A [Podoviridae sp. ctlpi2]